MKLQLKVLRIGIKNYHDFLQNPVKSYLVFFLFFLLTKSCSS